MPGLTLVIDTQNRKLVRGFTSTIDAQIPALFQGDTIDPLNLRFVTPTGISGAPYADVDYSDAFVQVGIGVIGTKPTGGTWTLTDTGAAQTTAAMAYGATAAAVQSAIRAALTTNWPLAVVTGGDGGPYIITNGSNGAESLLSAGASLLTPVSSVDISTVQDGDADKPEIQYVLLTQSPIAYQDDFSAVAAPTISVTEIADGGVGQNEIQLVTLTGSPYSGSFSLVFDDGADSESSDLIAWNATAAEVQEILEAVVLIGAGNVSVAGDAGGPWTITFIGDLAATSFDLMTSANTLVGPLMVTSDLGLNTGSIDEDIGETASITRTFSIKVTPLGGLPSTVAQVNCTIFNDLIRGAITIPTPGPSYLTAAQVMALLADYLPLDGSEPMTGDLDMDGNKITNLPEPSAASDAATRNYVDRPRSLALGYLFNDNFDRASLGSDYTVVNGSWAISSNELAVSGGIGNSDYLCYYDAAASLAESWVTRMRYVVGAKAGLSFEGLGLVIKPLRNDATRVSVFLNTSDDGTYGGLIYLQEADDIYSLTSESKMIPTVGDEIEATLSRIGNRITATFKNITTGTSLSVSDVLEMTDAATTAGHVKPGAGNFGMFIVRGAFTVTNFSAYRMSGKYPEVLFIGDSITSGYSCGDGQSFPEIINSAIAPKRGQVYAGPGDRTNEILQVVSEIIALEPRTAVILLGTNDLSGGSSSATFVANMRTLVDALETEGIVCVICKLPPRDDLDVTAFNAALTTEFHPDNLVIDLFTPLKNAGDTDWQTAYVDSGGVHPNADGHSAIASLILNEISEPLGLQIG